MTMYPWGQSTAWLISGVADEDSLNEVQLQCRNTLPGATAMSPGEAPKCIFSVGSANPSLHLR